MTEASYQRNRRKGVTGVKTDTCLAASFDRISRKHEVSTQTYQECLAVQAACIKEVGRSTSAIPSTATQLRYTEYEQTLWRELGLPNSKNPTEKHANSKSALEKILKGLIDKDFRVCVVLKTKAYHQVGLMRGPDDGLYIARSTWIPWNTEVVSVEDVWKYILRSKSKNMNILALPPG